MSFVASPVLKRYLDDPLQDEALLRLPFLAREERPLHPLQYVPRLIGGLGWLGTLHPEPCARL